MDIPTVPLNSLAWVFGTVALSTLGYKSWRSWQKTKDPFTGYIAWFGLIIGLSLGIIGIPPFLTHDEKFIATAFSTGLCLTFLALLVQSRVVWWLMLHNRIPFWPIGLVVGLAGLYASIQGFIHTYAIYVPNFVYYEQPRAASLTLGIEALVIFGATGLFFLRQVFRQPGLPAKLKSVSVGLTYTIVGSSVGINNIVNGHGATPQSSVFNIIFFTVLFAGLMIPQIAAPVRIQKHQPPALPAE
ncbi:MAG TPA: hypothetical protein VNA68_02370 [Candidatus Dormibacteraeota bacterium]|nr:hypothetical protein [Candidatus Dormibacteraeota bacterium]